MLYGFRVAFLPWHPLSASNRAIHALIPSVLLLHVHSIGLLYSFHGQKEVLELVPSRFDAHCRIRDTLERKHNDSCYMENTLLDSVPDNRRYSNRIHNIHTRSSYKKSSFKAYARKESKHYCCRSFCLDNTSSFRNHNLAHHSGVHFRMPHPCRAALRIRIGQQILEQCRC